MNDNNSWNEYSKMVLKELEVLSKSINGLKTELEALKHQITEMRAKEDRVVELLVWKSRIDDVASPSQLKDLQKEVALLQDFKVKATTVFIAAQAVIAGAFAILKLF